MRAEDVFNNALDLIHRPRIFTFYDGTVESLIGADIFATTRDALLNQVQPDWSHKDATLTLLKSAPGIVNGAANYVNPWDPAFNPPIPWLYEYAVPVDCLEPLQIKAMQVFLPVWKPRAQPFRLAYDPVTANQVVLTNTEEAMLVYVAQILNPDDWQADFRDMVIEALAKRMSVELARKEPANASNAAG